MRVQRGLEGPVALRVSVDPLAGAAVLGLTSGTVLDLAGVATALRTGSAGVAAGPLAPCAELGVALGLSGGGTSALGAGGAGGSSRFGLMFAAAGPAALPVD